MRLLLGITLFTLLAACSSGGGGTATPTYTVTATSGSNGSIVPASATVNENTATAFTVTPDSGYAVSTISGCSGTLSGSTYTTGTITAACTISVSFAPSAPITAAVPTLSYTQIKGFKFDWTDVGDATFYRLLENPDGASGFSQIGSDIPQGTGTNTITVPLYQRLNAQYILQSCNAIGCTNASQVAVSGTLATGIGYFKASNTNTNDIFGRAISFSRDGNTMAVGAIDESSNAAGINGSQTNNSSNGSGAVYVFTRSGSTWAQQAYIKASTNGSGDQFGIAVSLSEDGNTLAVGAHGEDSNHTGVGGLPAQANNSVDGSGAVYIFARSGSTWIQQAYIKASNTGDSDLFGGAVALSNDGNTLAVGASGEDSNATGIGGSEANDSLSTAGAVYIFTRSGSTWTQQAYIKASNTGDDSFGIALALNGSDGNTLAVGATQEASNATGIGGDQANNSSAGAGAVYVFTRSGSTWTQQAYIKASNTDASDLFGIAVALNNDGNTLAVGAHAEASNASGVGGNQADNSSGSAGAVYVFTRSGSTWTQQAYIKASNTDASDQFGTSVTLTSDGNTLAVGADGEKSNATGLGGNQTDNSLVNAGAAYIFTRSGSTWTQLAYTKASNTASTLDSFGKPVVLNGAGDTLAIGAHLENSNATGIGGNQNNSDASSAGAVYLY